MVKNSLSSEISEIRTHVKDTVSLEISPKLCIAQKPKPVVREQKILGK